MKVLIPTDDCLTIAPDFDNAKSFRLMTINNGSIKEDAFITSSVDLKKRYPFGLKELGEDTPQEVNTSDASNLINEDKLNQKIVIVSAISIEAEKNLQKKNYEVFRTEETNIFNALIFYLKDHATMESDYCCCP